MKLLIYRGDTLERTLELAARDFRIGRAVENDIVLEDPEKTVSRFHAELRYEHDAYALIDLNSQNGTWIDGERVRRTGLGPGQSAVMGTFRIEIEGPAPGGPAAPAASDTLAGEMPRTIAMSADAAQALRANGGAASVETGADMASAAQAGAPASGSAAAARAAAPAAASLSAPSHAGPSHAAPAHAAPSHGAPTHGAKQASRGDRREGSASIPRPLLYGGALVFLLMIIGVMYIFRPQPGPPPESAPQAETGGPESNEQIIARLVGEGREKLQAGDTAGALAAASRALVVDANNAEAIELRVKAEERRRQDELAAQTSSQSSGQTPAQTPGQTAGQSATPTAGQASGQTFSQTPSQTQGKSAGQTAQTATQGATTTPVATTTAVGTTGAKPGTMASTTTGVGTTTAVGKPGTSTGSTASGASGSKPTASRAQRRAAADREQDLAKRYAAARSAMSAGNYTEAAAAFEAIVRDSPGYRDAASMLDQSRGHIRTQAQQVTQQAAELAAKGQFAAAIAQYERARRLDPSLAGVEQGIASVRKQMKDAGDDAFRRARQLDAVGRAQAALPLYERAASLLPADDDNGRAARERMEALKRTP